MRTICSPFFYLVFQFLGLELNFELGFELSLDLGLVLK